MKRRMASTQSRSTVSRRTAALLCAVLGAMLLLATCVVATEILVGGKAGWDVGINSSKIKCRKGDILVFLYKKQRSNVLEVSKEDYERCKTDSPKRKYNSGKDLIRVYNTGTYYYIDGKEQHCRKGVKLEVKVKKEGDHD